MNLRYVLLGFVLLPFGAQATVTSQANTTGFPGSVSLTAINFSSLALTSSGDFSLDNGAINLFINTPARAVNTTSPGGTTISGTTPAGEGIVKGSTSGIDAAPVTDSAGATWTGNYISTGFGDVVLTFSQPIYAFALLWGSVDPTNELDLIAGGSLTTTRGVTTPNIGTTLIGKVLGSNIAADATGSQIFGGSFYTLITSTVAFNQVYLTSDAVSFEAADFEVEPEPDTVLLTLGGLMILLGVGRRKTLR